MTVTFAGFDRADVSGVPVLWRSDRRYKTFRFTLQALRPLDQQTAARSLLPALLMQGTERDSDRPALARRMEDLYGAVVRPWTGKQGEAHGLACTLDSIAGRFVPGDPDLFGAGLELLADLLTRPKLEAGAFPPATFAREKLQAAHAARALFNDKTAWAQQRALEHACAGEPMAIPEDGGLEAIEALTPDQPELARQDALVHGEWFAIAFGALPAAGVLERVAGLLAKLPPRRPMPRHDPVVPEPRPRRMVVEHADLQQSKLVMTFRLPWTRDPRVWVGRVLFANMLGGGPHSRLFTEVREKHSLAYYAAAGLERFKGLLTVQVGLDQAQAARVEDEVVRQAEALRAGQFTRQELDTAQAMIASTLASADDSIGDRMQFTARQWLLGQDRTPEQQAALYLQTTPDQVAAAVSGLWLDHVYLLAPTPATGGQR